MSTGIKKPALFFGKRVFVVGLLWLWGRGTHLEVQLRTWTAIWLFELVGVTKVDIRIEPVDPSGERLAIQRVCAPIRRRCNLGCSSRDVVDLLCSLTERLGGASRRPNLDVPFQCLAFATGVVERDIKGHVIRTRHGLRWANPNRGGENARGVARSIS